MSGGNEFERSLVPQEESVDRPRIEFGRPEHAEQIYSGVKHIANVGIHGPHVRILEMRPHYRFGRVTDLGKGDTTDVVKNRSVVTVNIHNPQLFYKEFPSFQFHVTSEGLVAASYRLEPGADQWREIPEAPADINEQVRRVLALSQVPGYILEHFGSYGEFIWQLMKKVHFPEPGIVTDAGIKGRAVFGYENTFISQLEEFMESIKHERWIDPED